MKLHSAFDLSGLKASQLLQVVELDFLYPSEGIHKRWDNGYRITAMGATMDQSALILSKPRRRPKDETQETLRTTQFPSQHVKVGHELRYLTCFSLIILFFLTCSFGCLLPGEVGQEPLPCWDMLWANRGLTSSVADLAVC